MTNTELETGLSAVETELALPENKVEQKFSKPTEFGR
jgi:hypothetical protein